MEKPRDVMEELLPRYGTPIAKETRHNERCDHYSLESIGRRRNRKRTNNPRSDTTTIDIKPGWRPAPPRDIR
jgi:hypothetical protein